MTTKGFACLLLQAAVIRALWIDGITWRLKASREFGS
jgi:hypothetical protein